MATNWDSNWDDEEWLKRQNAVTLHSIFREAQAQGKDTAVIKKVVVNQLHSITDFKQTSSYDLLSYLKVADETDLTVTGNDGQTRNLKEEIKSVVTAREKTLENNDDLISRLNRKALLEAAKIVGTTDEASNIQASIDTQVKPELENKLQTSTASNEEFDQFDMAERSGALDDISDSAKNAFIDKLAEMSKWKEVEGQLVIKNDNALLKAVSSLDVYKQDGSLNDVYSDCAELADKIQFEYPEGSTDAQKAELAKAYKQQLLANAAQRATNEILKDRSLLMRHKTADEILNAYKAEVYNQFERGVVIAGLTTSKATGTLLDNVKLKRDENTGKITYGDNIDDATKQAIDDILSGNIAINPLTVQMDTYQLDVETRAIERILKRKKVDTKKLGFWTKAKNGVKAAYENIAKKGGWKKLALNSVIFGGAAMAMAAGGGIALGGAGLYAGWTTVNAWLTPVYDKLNNEMYEQKVKGFKARRAYIKQNWSRARKEKHQEPGFKSRAWWRTGEGAVIGGLTGGMGFLGITGWTKVFSRQGAMAAGKGGSLIRSLFKRKKAKEALETNYSMDNYNALQTAESYLKQDEVTLGFVVGGALLGDGIKAGLEYNAVTESLESVDENVSEESVNNEDLEEGTIDATDEAPVEGAAVSEIKDEAGNIVETHTVTTGVDGNKIVEVKDAEGNVIGSGTQKFVGPTGETTSEITYNDGRQVTETVARDGSKTVETEYPNGLKVSQNVNSEGEVVSSSTKFDASNLSNAEKRMYQNSFSKWDNNALANRIAEIEKEGGRINPEIRQILNETLGDKAYGKDVVAGFYEVIAAGKVESLPEGVSAVEYVDKLTRLAQLAPIVQKDAIQIMIKDLLCEDFHPSEAEIAIVNKALGTIVYENGKMECVIPDRNGNLCLRTESMFGQYVGQQQMANVEMPDGSVKQLPLRTANYTTGLRAEVDCGAGRGIIKSTWIVGRLPDCGCNNQPEIPEPIVQEDTPVTPVDYTVSEGDVNGFVNTAVAPEPTQFNVNFTDPFSRATAAYANGSQDYMVEGNIPDGAQVIRLDSRGHLHLWQKGAVVAGSEVVSGQGGVEAMYSTALNLNMNNLGSAHITDDANILSFQYGQGKHALTFVLDKRSGEMRTFLGNLKAKNEIVLDQETARRAAIVLNKTMHESGLGGTYKLNFGAETEQNNEHLSDYLDSNEKAKVEQGINRDIDKAVKKGADKGMETTQFEQPETVPVYTPARLTSEQQAALLSDNAKIMSNGQVEGGQMIFEVKGVEGVERLAMPALRSVSVANSQPATVEISPDVHQHLVRIPGADGQKYTVQINSRGGAAQVLDADGHKVYLDETSAKAFGTATKQALEANGVKGVGNIDLNPYPKGSLGAKCVAAYNGYMQQQNLAQAVQSAMGRK